MRQSGCLGIYSCCDFPGIPDAPWLQKTGQHEMMRCWSGTHQWGRNGSRVCTASLTCCTAHGIAVAGAPEAAPNSVFGEQPVVQGEAAQVAEVSAIDIHA